MKVTVKEIRAMLEGLPDNLPVEFAPITMAWLGTSNPMRFEEIHFYKDGEHALPSEKGAVMQVHLVEDSRDDRTS